MIRRPERSHLRQAAWCLLLAITLYSCTSTDDDRRACTADTCIYGECIRNVCQCDTGYMGESCDSPVSERWIGVWDLDYTCSNSIFLGSQGSGQVVITEGDDMDHVIMDIFSRDVICELRGVDSLLTQPWVPDDWQGTGLSVQLAAQVSEDGTMQMRFTEMLVGWPPLGYCDFIGYRE